jgi:putative FmdB family regulatory protein
MPIFEYRCDDCGTRFEKLVRRAETGGLRCPSCGEAHLTQQLTTFAAHSNSGPAPARAEAPMCPGGMCRTPGLCGMN